MTTENKIKVDSDLNEIAKEFVDYSNLDKSRKDKVKFLLDVYHENNKYLIIKNDIRRKDLEELLDSKESK